MDEDVLEREIEFHNEWANSVDPASVPVDKIESACTLPETRFIISQIEKKNIKNKEILEIGCGCGEASVYFAKCGGYVTATDISQGMVELANKVADYHHTTIKRGVVCSAEELPFEEDSFDIVYAANVLHHVDIEKALSEIKRVLKPGGLFLCWDPIRYNPAINIYRKLASGVRTIDEHPIDIQYLKSIKAQFSNVKYNGFWLFTNLIFVKYYFIDKLNPSKVRYWKYIIEDEENIKHIYEPLERIDRVLLKIFPFLKWMCWNMVIIADNRR